MPQVFLLVPQLHQVVDDVLGTWPNGAPCGV